MAAKTARRLNIFSLSRAMRIEFDGVLGNVAMESSSDLYLALSLLKAMSRLVESRRGIERVSAFDESRAPSRRLARHGAPTCSLSGARFLRAFADAYIWAEFRMKPDAKNCIAMRLMARLP